MPTTLIAGTDAVRGALLLRQHLDAHWNVSGVPIVWPNTAGAAVNASTSYQAGWVRAFIVPITGDIPRSQGPQPLVETEELLTLWINAPAGQGTTKAYTWYTLLARALEATAIEGLTIYDVRRFERGVVDGFYRVDLQARLIRRQVTRMVGHQPGIEGVLMAQGHYVGHGFGAVTLPAPFVWIDGVPEVPTLTGAVGEGAAGIVVEVASGDLVTWHAAGVVRMVHGLGAAGPRWMDEDGALVGTEPAGLKQVVLTVIDSTHFQVTLGPVYA